MLTAANADIRLFPQQKPIVALLIEDALQNHKIQFPRFQPGQQAGGIVHQKLQRVARLGKKPADLGKQNVIANGFCGPHAQQCLRLFVQPLHQLFFVVAQRHCILLQQLARAGLVQAAGRIGEQLHAVFGFQCLDVLAHGRLRKV